MARACGSAARFGASYRRRYGNFGAKLKLATMGRRVKLVALWLALNLQSNGPTHTSAFVLTPRNSPRTISNGILAPVCVQHDRSETLHRQAFAVGHRHRWPRIAGPFMTAPDMEGEQGEMVPKELLERLRDKKQQQAQQDTWVQRLAER